MCLKEQIILWEKKKMLVTSIFFFCHNCFKGCLCQDYQISRLCGKQLNQKAQLTHYPDNLCTKCSNMTSTCKEDWSHYNIHKLRFSFNPCRESSLKTFRVNGELLVASYCLFFETTYTQRKLFFL